jgi:hypothetical protein
MLWTMLNAICFLACMFGSVGAARAARTGPVGYVLAMVIGLALGGSFTWVMWKLGGRVGAAVQAHPEPKRELYFRVLYVAAVLWVLIALFVTDRLTSAAIRLAG